MLICGGKVFLGKEFLYLDFRVEDGVFKEIAEPGTLAANPGEEVVYADGKKVLPGLVDIHTHGRVGADFSFATEKNLQEMCRSYADCGVTSVLATTMTNEPKAVEESLKTIGAFCEKEHSGARILGVHMEGPFLGKEKKGAHDPQYLEEPSVEKYIGFQKLCGQRIRLLTIDPTLPHAKELIRQCRKDGVAVSLGHTACEYETACEAANEGADHVTHLFNAMNPLHHRKPGLIGAAVDCGMYTELICDGIHLHPMLIRMMFRLAPEKVVLISDSMQAAGLSDGEYELGGLSVFVKDGKATQADGTIAGSTTNIYDAMVNVIRFGIPEEEAVYSASYLPAKSIGMEQVAGSIAVGRKADFLLAGDDWKREAVYIGGIRENEKRE